jgi:phosphate-selective porin OprO/OprP
MRKQAASQGMGMRHAGAGVAAFLALAAAPAAALGDSAKPSGFTIAPAGVIQLDSGVYVQDDRDSAGSGRPLEDGAEFRRARVGARGQVVEGLDYSVLFELAGPGDDTPGRLYEAWLQYAPVDRLKLRAGAFAPNVGLVDATSASGTIFIERPSIAEIARSLAGGDARLGAQAGYSTSSWLAVGAVTGGRLSDKNDIDEQLGFTGRIAATPLKGEGWRVHVGANGSVVTKPQFSGSGAARRRTVRLSDRPELRIDPGALIATPTIPSEAVGHWSLELALQKGPFLVQGERVEINVERSAPAAVRDPSFSGWYVETNWVLNGARRYNTGTGAFDAPDVARPFSPSKRQWGVFEVGARYSTADLNDFAESPTPEERVRGGEQAVWTVGINWRPTSHVRFVLDFIDAEVDRRSAAGVPIGRSLQAVALRSQLTF